MNEQQRKATLTRQLAKAKYDIETLENSLVACNRTMVCDVLHSILLAAPACGLYLWNW